MRTNLLKYILTVLVFISSMTEVTLIAADSTVKSGGKFNDQEKVEMTAKAEDLKDRGGKAMRLYLENKPGKPSDLVDAAVAFDQAHELYKKIGDPDNISETQSSLNLCKKAMDLETLNLYLERTNKGSPTKELPRNEPAKTTLAVTPTIPADEKALNSAHAFAKAHPDDVSAVANAYADVASKFPNTKSATDAQALADKFQAKYDAWVKAGGNLPQTRFTKISAETLTPKFDLPDSKIVNDCITDLKKVFAKEYAKKTNEQKVELAEKLIAESDRVQDPNLRFANLIEAVRLAQEGEQYLLMLDTIDAISRLYIGYDVSADRKKWLQRASGRPAAGAILTLLDTPRDEPANVVAGRYLCFQAERWKDGLPLLVIGNDPDLKTLASQELKAQNNEKHNVELADGWFDIAKKTSSLNEKYGILRHARQQYKRTRGLDTVTQDRVNKRLDEIEKTLPLDLDSIDFNKLTASQWERLPGGITVAPTRVARTGLGQLRAGQKVRIVPHPEETAAYGTFRIALDSGKQQAPGVILGPGTLWAFPALTRGDERGSVRLKVMPLESE